jgi:endonuclease/exonuclease/phosphatase family metal-dependent hydrolase
VLDSATADDARPQPPRRTGADSIVVASYNIHSAIGGDRHHDPGRIAAVIAEIDPDIAGLQEVTASAEEAVCVARILERQTGLHAVFGRSTDRGGGHFGNMLLSRWPVVSHRVVDLTVNRFEHRSALIASLDAPFPLRVVVTHLGLWSRERRKQVERLRLQLAEHDGQPAVAHPTLFMGDFNCWGKTQRLLCTLGAPLDRPHRPRSFPAAWPTMALDRIWMVPDALLDGVAVHRSPLSLRASDHLPVVARFVPRGLASAA